MEYKDIEKRFTHHKPKEDDACKLVVIREDAKYFADIINSYVPEGREKNLAITKLEEVVMWANAGIARKGDK
jgi:hypothetical protein